MIRKCKTDKVDAHRIAVLLKNGKYRSALIPGELAMTCRQVTRLRYRLVKQRTRLKQLIRAQLHPVWPEYENLFANPFSVTSRKLLVQSPVLRHTLWQMAHRAIYQEGDLRQFWLRKRAQQKHHFVAVTAVAGKLCDIIWRIMTDERDYVPDHRPATS
jgi:hypothetical protein